MNLELGNSENLVKQGSANHWQGWEAVGGRLFLTDQRLVFKSHRFNLQKHQTSIGLEEIAFIKPSNIFLVVPNGMSVFLKNGNKEEFVVWNRKDWIDKIGQIRRAREQASAKGGIENLK